MHIVSGLNVAGLHDAFQQLVDRHSSLRTIYTVRDGKPVQQILASMPVDFEEVDYSLQSEEELHEALIAVAHQPFTLEREGTLQVRLFTGAELGPILLLTAHHIATDFWSMVVLMDELRILYQAQRTGTVQADLPLLPLQYTDYMQWEARLVKSPVGIQSQLYWEKQLAGELPVLNLPTDRPRLLIHTNRGGRHFFSIDEALTSQIRQFARSESVTLYTVLLTAFQVLLARYSGQDTFLIGSPTTNRSRVELQNMVGYLVNPVVLSAQVTPTQSFKALLRQVSTTVLAALEHQDYSFLLLVEQLLADRDPSRSPIFDVMFVLDRPHRSEMLSMPEIAIGKPGAHMDLGGLQIASFPLRQQSAQFDLTLLVIEGERTLSVSWEYNSDLFDVVTIEHMAAHFQHLLEEIVAKPDEKVEQLALMGAQEYQQVVHLWNQTTTTYPARDLASLFEEQVHLRPETIALHSEEHQLSYGELNRRANQLAHALRRRGVGPEVLVGVCLERSLDLLIALLGILKAGGAYVPLDQRAPSQRLAFVLRDAGIALVLTQDALRAALPAEEIEVFCLDQHRALLAEHATENLPPDGLERTVEQLAYVLYTSGSTGQPKGVEVSQRNVVRLVKATTFMHLDAEETLLQFAPVAFDASTLEIWGSLLNGARLVLFPAHRPSLEELGRGLQRWGVSTLWLTAGLFHQMVEGHLQSLRGVRQLLAGGDVLSVQHVQQVLEGLPETTLINGYGPTENTTFTCTHAMRPGEQVQGTVPIGHPIANSTVYLLDGQLQPVPIGVPGELYTGGAGVARGYLREAALTAEYFVPDPFAGQRGARLYRTGDQARYRSDGRLEFLGRQDHQVKVRGYRIEEGEIEAVLRQYPGVQDALVQVREEGTSEKRLVGYLVADPATQQELVREEQAAYIATWQALYAQTYRQQETPAQQDAATDGAFDLVGWNSSYTGKPIAEEQMREQVEQTIARVLALRPQRVLEIGCGTGLLLSRVAPSTQRYVGTDFSPEILGWLGQQEAVQGLPQVQLLQRVAHDVNGLQQERFDLVILNSTVQYFPECRVSGGGGAAGAPVAGTSRDDAGGRCAQSAPSRAVPYLGATLSCGGVVADRYLAGADRQTGASRRGTGAGAGFLCSLAGRFPPDWAGAGAVEAWAGP